ncbi:MAG: 50S ribosomal protein L36 [bacterium (Candidatus Stahlbacteria) CG23_combo_of_CG06-09_8_20_14_all_34_7]|nr:MAG: 50S ribosomal protein L36 [bacterium (Candidatus Stahlbacteria) CG23_combo_of_CG06-09_8_20_14_all_34_7]
MICENPKHKQRQG